MEGAAKADQLVLGRSIAPPKRRRQKVQPQDENWLPGAIADVAISRQGIWVLDDVKRELTVLSPSLRQRKTWSINRTEDGYANSFPIAVAPAIDDVWVLFQNPSRAEKYSRQGHRTGELVLNAAVIDIATAENDDLWLAYGYAPAVLESIFRMSDTVVLVGRLSSIDMSVQPLVQITRKDLDGRINLPGIPKIRLVAAGKRLAVIFVTTGLIEVYDGDGAHVTLQTCVPANVIEAYAEQLRVAGPRPRAQGWTPLVTDVRFEGDTAITVATPLPDPEHGYHLERFSSEGLRLAGRVAAKQRYRLPWEWRLIDASSAVLAFEQGGLIQVFHFGEPRS